MPSIADHFHWAGGHWTTSRTGNLHSDAGGGHAHVGCMVYLGDNWPKEYRNNVFTLNIHGNRLNRDTLEFDGSTYVAHHAPDFLFANDPWFRGLVVKYGPDGGVYISDWTDTGECHNYEVADTSNGRIYKVVYGQPAKPAAFDLAQQTDRELIDLQFHKNDWHVRHARRLLQERSQVRQIDKEAVRHLIQPFRNDELVNLRVNWALHAMGLFTQRAVREWMTHDKSGQSEHIRSWAIQLGMDLESLDPVETTAFFRALASAPLPGESPRVLRALASAIPRLVKSGRDREAFAILHN
jgi:hypothetical protein